jgi:hypothetical protein
MAAASRASSRRFPSGIGEGPFEPERPPGDGIGIVVSLDFLTPVRKCDHQFVGWSIALMSNLVPQSRILPLEKPNHAARLSAQQYRTLE